LPRTKNVIGCYKISIRKIVIVFQVQYSSEDGGHGYGHALYYRLVQKDDYRSWFQGVDLHNKIY